MNEYKVKVLAKAYRDMDDICEYVENKIGEKDAANRLMDNLESEVIGLAIFPYRGAERKVGVYAGKGYRQLFVSNFIIIYKINEVKKEVIVVTVKYCSSQF